MWMLFIHELLGAYNRVCKYVWLAQVPVVMWSNDDVGDPWRFQGKDMLPTKIQVSISEVFKNLSTCTVQAINCH
mgnify:CR=1 FL=1